MQSVIRHACWREINQHIKQELFTGVCVCEKKRGSGGGVEGGRGEQKVGEKF